MMRSRTNTNSSALELAIVGAAMIALLLIELAATHTFSLFSQPLWLDECLTHLLANDPSIRHEFSALAGGVDTTPPTFYIVLRALRLIVGTLGATSLRTFSFASIVIALIGIYTICRRFFDPIAAFAGVLSVFSHQAVVEQLFEARHYGFWLAAIVWCCYFQIDAGKIRRSLILASVCAVAVTTVHWLGIIVVVMIGASDVISHYRSSRGELIRRALPMYCGIAGTLASLPFLIGQRRGLTVPSWIDPISLSQIRDLLKHLFASPPLVCVILIYWICRVIAGSTDRERPRRDLTELAPTTSLLLLPIVLIIASKVFQPMLLMRYVVPAIVPLAPLTAALASEMSSRSGRLARVGLLIVLAIISAGELRNLGASHDLRSDTVASNVQSIDEIVRQHGPLPVIFLRRLEHFPAIFLRPNLAADVAQIRFDQAMPFELKRRTQYEQIMAKRVRKFYEQYRMIDFSKLREMKHFYVTNPPDGDEDTRQVFAGAKIESRGPSLFEVTLP